MTHIGRDSKETIISRFGKHVSSGKADFFTEVVIDFVFGCRDGPDVRDTASSKRLINGHCSGGVFDPGHRKFDRFLQRALFRRHYEYILPGQIPR